MKKNKYDNLPEFRFLVGKSITGIFYWTSIVGLLLMVIGVSCPFCSYNLTRIEDLKSIVKFGELSSVPIIVMFILLAAACVLYFISIDILMKSNWRKKSKLLLAFGIINTVLILISIIITMYACISYEIPEEHFDFGYIEIQMEVGFYLFAVGIGLFAGCFMLFVLGLYSLANGKTTLDALRLGAKKAEVVVVEQNPQTLSEKLLELQKLKDDNLITEEEYQTKKQELLKDYK